MASIFEYSKYKKHVFKITSKIYFQCSHKCHKLHVNETEQSDEYEGPASWEKKAYDDIPYTEPRPLRKLVTTSCKECSYLNLIPSPWSKKLCQQQ